MYLIYALATDLCALHQYYFGDREGSLDWGFKPDGVLRDTFISVARGCECNVEFPSMKGKSKCCKYTSA